MSRTREDALRRIQKLMRTADSNATEGEVRNALRMASEQMAKWDLTDADLADAAGERQLSAKVVELEAGRRATSLEIIDRNLVRVVSILCDCRVIFRGGGKGSTEKLILVGLERDAAMGVQLWNDLRLQMRILARHRCGKKWSPAHGDYCKGFAAALLNRARSIKQSALNAVGPNCTAIVLRKEAAVDNYMDQKYGKLKGRRGRGQSIKNAASFIVGQADAKAVDLGKERAAGDRALGETKRLPGA